MGVLKPFEPVKIFFGILLNSHITLDIILESIRQDFGEIDFCSEVLDFSYSSYYEPEMGAPLKRCFVSLKKLGNPQDAYHLKLKSNDLEMRLAGGIENHRCVNLDPGLLSKHNLILLTTKNYSHRIPLQAGIYAEVTLIWSGKKFQDVPWTYPDYRSEDYKRIFERIRGLF